MINNKFTHNSWNDHFVTQSWIQWQDDSPGSYRYVHFKKDGSIRPNSTRVRHIECPTECCICYKSYEDNPESLVSKTDCDHFFCYECLKKWVIDNKNNVCPMCKKQPVIPIGNSFTSRYRHIKRNPGYNRRPIKGNSFPSYDRPSIIDNEENDDNTESSSNVINQIPITTIEQGMKNRLLLLPWGINSNMSNETSMEERKEEEIKEKKESIIDNDEIRDDIKRFVDDINSKINDDEQLISIKETYCFILIKFNSVTIKFDLLKENNLYNHPLKHPIFRGLSSMVLSENEVSETDEMFQLD